jgi:Ca2+/Na+ antiporter
MAIRRLPASRVGRWSALCVLFAAAAVVQTWPLVLHATDAVADSPAGTLPDTYAFVWNLSWVKQAIVDVHTNPFQTDFLFFPDGENLYLHPLTLLNGVLSIPLQLATGNLFLSWNVLALLFFVLSGLGAYALAYRVTNNHLAAVLAGYIFAFAPVVLMQFNGRWHISTVWPIPLIALFLLRFLDKGRLREAAAAGIVWAMLTYNNQEFALDAALFIGLFFVYWSVVYLRRKDNARLQGLWRAGAVVAGVWLVMSAPLIIPASIDARSGEYHLPAGDEFYSASLRSFVTPSPLWGPGEDPVGWRPEHSSIGDMENTLYLGAVPLILATLAILHVRRRPHAVVFWGAVFLSFITLALGPYLYVGDAERFSVLGLSVPLPYQIYDQLPLFGDRRVPSRMLPFGMLGLGVLAGIGFDALMSWLRRNYKLLAPAVTVLIVSLVVVEYWNPPLHMSHLPRPAILEQIRDEPGDFTVLAAPLGRRTGWGFNGHFEGANISDYYQTVHGKRTFGGFIARTREGTLGWLRQEPGLEYIAFPGEGPSGNDLDPEIVQAVFRRLRIKYVVLHKLGPHGQTIDTPATLDVLDAYLRGVVDLTPIFSDSSLAVYRNGEVQ